MGTVKVRHHRFTLGSIARGGIHAGYWFCVWLGARASFDTSVYVTDKIWRAAIIIRDTILAG